MRLCTNFILRLSPSPQVVIYTYSSHAGECGETLLLHLTVSAVKEMSVRAYYQRMLSLCKRRIDRTFHGMSVYGFHTEVLHRIAIILSCLPNKRFLVGASCKQRINAKAFAYLLAQSVAASLP